MLKKNVLISALIILLCVSICYSMIFDGYSVAQPSEGNMIYVNINGGSNFTTIQDAIDAAEDGDTIYVYGGVYNENIVIDKRINLVGEDVDSVILDGQGQGDVIKLTGSSNFVNITGFTVQNSGNQYYDSGININSDYNTIAGNIIMDCNNGIYLDFWGHNCKIYSNIIKDSIYGIIVYSVAPNNNVIYHNDFINNYINAYDDSNSYWDNAGEGNYWDDYMGSDDNGDGIGDTPYLVSGGNAKDNYPLIEPNETPGFELLLILIVISILVIIKKRNN